MAAINTGPASIAETNATLFERQVKHAYQGEGMGGTLRGTVRTRLNIRGETVSFPKLGQIQTQELFGQPGMSLPQSPGDYSEVSEVLKKYFALRYSSINWAAQVVFEDRQELAQAISNSLGRRADATILQAIKDSSGHSTGTASGAGSLRNLARQARQAFDSQGVPRSDCCMVIRGDKTGDLYGDNNILSSDYSGGRTQETGQLPPLYGFRIYVIETNRQEGGVAASSAYFYHKAALGYGESLGNTRIDWAPTRGAYAVQAFINTGGVVIDNKGLFVGTYS